MVISAAFLDLKPLKKNQPLMVVFNELANDQWMNTLNNNAEFIKKISEYITNNKIDALAFDNVYPV